MSSEYLENIKCCVCGNTEKSGFSVRFQKNGVNIMQCNNCSFIFIPPYYRKNISYVDYKDEKVADAVRKGNNWIKIQRNLLRYDLIRKFVPKGKLFDLGVGWGHFLLAGKKLGYDVYGIEISHQPYLYSKNDLGLPVDRIDFFEMPEDNKYDVLTMWDVLEHIDAADKVVEKCARMINKGGYIFIQVPQIDSFIAKRAQASWNMMGLDHVNYFSKKTLTLLLEKNGFKVKTIKSSIELKLLLMYTILPWIKRWKKKSKNEEVKITSADRQEFFNKVTNKSQWQLSLFVKIHNLIYRTLSALKIGEEMIVVAEKQ